MYKNFAYIYDKLMYDVDYHGYTNHIKELIKNCTSDKPIIADLGCGTGTLCIKLAKEGFDMIGIDISEDMLCVAKEKAMNENLEILFLNQDMTEFELYGTVDACISMMDSVNYILDEDMLLNLFKNVNNYLNPNGFFVFDMNTEYKLENTLGSNVFYEVGEDFTYIWQNEYDSESKICNFDLTFFEKTGDSYQRYDEQQSERAWSVEEIKYLIEKSGLRLEKLYAGLDFEKHEQSSERFFYLCKKSNN